MANKKTSTDILKNGLVKPYPDGNRHEKNIASHLTLLSNEMPMTVTLNELRPSKVLPRIKKNERYEDIKASIRAKGLDQPPPITKIPGDEFYTISDGGNTRLQILNELYEETGELRFFNINCLYRPWRGELKSIVGHLAENELRADFTFIEKAIGVSKSRKIIEEECGKSLSLRELSDKLKDEGYPISHALLGKMLNTINYLYPYIPKVLESGLSRNEIEKILDVRSKCEKRFIASNNGSTDDKDFDTEFGMILMLHDVKAEEYQFNVLEDDLFGHFSSLLNIDYNLFNLDKDKEKYGNPFSFHPVETPTSYEDTPDVAVPSSIAYVDDEDEDIGNEHEHQEKTIASSIKAHPSDKPQQKSNANDAKKAMPTVDENDIDQMVKFVEKLVSKVNGAQNLSYNKDDFIQDGSVPILVPTAERVSDDPGVITNIHRQDTARIERLLPYQKQKLSEHFELEDNEDLMPFLYSSSTLCKTKEFHEEEPVVHFWKIRKNHHTYDSLARRIGGLVLDILHEFDIDDCCLDFEISAHETIKHKMRLRELSDEDSNNPDFVRVHALLNGLLHDDQPLSLNSNWFVGEHPLFNDFTMQKVFRLIRLKRAYDKLISTMHFTTIL